MEILKAIEIIKKAKEEKEEIIKEAEKPNCTPITHIYDPTMLFNKVSSEIIAIETVLQALEETRKENEKLKEIDLTTVHIKGVCDEKARWRNKIKEKIEEQTKRIDELLEDMVDKSTGCINVSYLSKKEKEEVIAKRNGLLVQKATLQQVKDELLKGE